MYIDCVSASGPLMALSNEIYNKEDPRNKYIKLFKGTFYKDAVPSKCGRRVVEVESFLKNVHEVMTQIEPITDPIERGSLVDVLTRTLRGIEKNPAQYDFHGHYTPADPT